MLAVEVVEPGDLAPQALVERHRAGARIARGEGGKYAEDEEEWAHVPDVVPIGLRQVARLLVADR